VCTPYQYQLSSHNPYLWQGSKYHQKGTPGACGEVPRSQEVPLGLSGGLGEEYGPIGEDWDYDKAKMGLGRREREGEQR